MAWHIESTQWLLVTPNITKPHCPIPNNQLRTLEETVAVNSQARKHDALNLSTFGIHKDFLHFLNNASLFPKHF